MTPQAAANKINNGLSQIPTLIENLTVAYANNSKDMVQTRVQSYGQTSRGGTAFDMSPYSERRTNERLAKGRQVNFVDLTFTGDMWRGIGITSQTVSGNIANVNLGGQNADTITKLVDMEAIKGFNLEPTDNERRIIEEDIQKDFEREITKLFKI